MRFGHILTIIPNQRSNRKTQTTKLRALLVGLLVLLTQTVFSQEHGIHLFSYDINATLLPSDKTLKLKVVCEIQKTDTVSDVKFLLNSNSNIQQIRCRSESGWLNLLFEFAGKDTLQLHLPSGIRDTGIVVLEFRYTFPVSLNDSTPLILDRGSRWYPLISDQVATMKLAGEVPPGYTVLSAGNLIETRRTGNNSRFVWESNLPLFKLPFVVFKTKSLMKISADVLDKNIILYTLFRDTLQANRVLSEACNIFKFYNRQIGSYPYAQLTFIETPDFEGTNIASGLLMVGSTTFRQMKQGNYDGLHLAVAEQWIGAGVFANFGKPGFWFFTISFPHYLRLMYLRETEGEAAFEKELQEPLQKYRIFAGKENDIPIIDVDAPNTREKGLILYAKGPLIVSKLHKQLGDEHWQAFLRDIYRDFRGKILRYDEFQKYIAKYGNNDSTLALFNRLMTQKGFPQ